MSVESELAVLREQIVQMRESMRRLEADFTKFEDSVLRRVEALSTRTSAVERQTLQTRMVLVVLTAIGGVIGFLVSIADKFIGWVR